METLGAITDSSNRLVMDGGRAVVSNDYWSVTHDPAHGGCPVSIVFANGSGTNFLAQPLGAHICAREGNEVRFYRESNYSSSKLSCSESSGEIIISSEGRFTSDKGDELPVSYKRAYTYSRWGLMRTSITFILHKPLTGVCELSIGSFRVSDKADVLGFRRASMSDTFPTTPFAEWHNVQSERSYRYGRGPIQQFLPLYFCVFQRGVEGLEFYRGSDMESWDRPFGIEAGQSVFTYERNSREQGFLIRIESFCNWNDPIALPAGECTFEYYIGLPYVKNSAYTRRQIFHAQINSHPWPSDVDLKRLADCGVKLIRLHDDNTSRSPSWPDGLYPPYSPENMAEMDRVIRSSHELGMKIIPYFSLKEFHPSCPEYGQNVESWKRWCYADGRTCAEDGPFGGYMCMNSGWLEYRKASIDKVLSRHAFDGVYYDHTWFHICRNPSHMEGKCHTDVDQVLEFLQWTRDRVGAEGVVFLHNSGCPSMIGENLASLIYHGEDMWLSNPLPGCHAPDMEFVPITPRNYVACGPDWEFNSTSHHEESMILILEGWPAQAALEDGFTLEQFRLLGAYNLDAYKFERASEGPVLTDSSNVYASLYHNEGGALVYCANLSADAGSFLLKIDMTSRGWDENAVITVSAPQGNVCLLARDLRDKGVSATIQPFNSNLLTLQPADSPLNRRFL